ncbi:MAG: hypothetical protein WD231_02670 [Candidatus Woykebacteria bacterium]
MNKKFIALIILLLAIVLMFFSYLFFVARPRAKAECLQAATYLVDRGDDSESAQKIAIGQEVVFDEARYYECLKF